MTGFLLEIKMRQPKLLTKIWAAIGLKNTIPESRGSGLAQGAATYDEGFPSITMTPITQGGKAPSGKDMNGILHEITAHIVHMNQGGHYKFDSGFAEKINGYSRGAVLINNDETAFFVSLIDQNKTDFNGGSDYGDYWIKLADVETVKQVHPKDLTEESISEKDHTGHSHRLPLASLIKKGIAKLYSGLDSNAEDMAATPRAIKRIKDLIDANVRNLSNFIPNSKKSNAINSPSSDTVATSFAVKTAYDKGVEAKNAADNAQNSANHANNNADGRVSKSGDTMTGNLTLPKVSLTANKIQFSDDFIYKNNSGNHLHGFHFTEDSGEPDDNSRGNASLYAKKFEATHIGNGAYANQYTSKAPFMVEENGSLPRDAYHPFVKGKVRTNNQWGAAFSFGYTTNQNPHGDGFGKGIIHLAENNGHSVIWSFEHDGAITGGDFRAQGKSLSQAVMQNEITYQKIGNFEIRKYPDGTMIQTYRFNPPNSRVGSQSNKFSFNWALAFTEKPKIWIQHIDLETGDHHGSIDMDMIIKWNETTNSKVTFWAWEWVFNNNQTNFDFLAIGRWK